MLALIVLLASMAMSIPAYSQIACFQYPGGVTSCDGPRGGNTTIVPLSRTQGIITQQNSSGSTMDPYSIMGQDNRRSSGGIEPLDRLERLPSYGSSQRSSSYEERERAREERYGR